MSTEHVISVVSEADLGELHARAADNALGAQGADVAGRDLVGVAVRKQDLLSERVRQRMPPGAR